jgi:predicted amidophosphoribosyltransferase
LAGDGGQDVGGDEWPPGRRRPGPEPKGPAPRAVGDAGQGPVGLRRSAGEEAIRTGLLGCPVCGQILPSQGLGGPVRGRCLNRWCHRADRAFSVAFAVGVHEGAMRHAVLRYKYGREFWWAGAFARLLANHLQVHSTWFEDFDLLVPTPSYLGPSARRDWDPVGQIAAELRPLVEPLWEVASGAVSKRRETPPMQGRPWADRQAIASGPLRRALWVSAPRVVSGARILVLDDVLTDGSTLREVARVLRQAGAREVAGLVLARPVWRDRPSDGRLES